MGPVFRRLGTSKVDALYRLRRPADGIPVSRFDMESLEVGAGFKLPTENWFPLPFNMEDGFSGDFHGDLANDAILGSCGHSIGDAAATCASNRSTAEFITPFCMELVGPSCSEGAVKSNSMYFFRCVRATDVVGLVPRSTGRVVFCELNMVPKSEIPHPGVFAAALVLCFSGVDMMD
jgi:hypothetical protein